MLSLRVRVMLFFIATVFFAGLSLTAVVYTYLYFTPVPFRAVLEGVLPGGATGEGAVIDGRLPIDHAVLFSTLRISFIALVILTLFAAAVGWFVAGFLIEPVRRIAAVARKVTAGDVEQRVRYVGPTDEVADLGEALDTMLDTLAASIAAQQRFAANASHELKTPIATIQTVADVALADPDATPEELRESLTQIRTVNASSATTITALLHFSQAEAKVLHASEVDLAELVIAQAGDNVSLQISEQDCTVTGDNVLLNHAVQNLISNAKKHGLPGTTTVVLSAEKERVVIDITNDGPVLESATLDQLKEPFRKGAGRVADAHRGHGLGLALANMIALAHGGQLILRARASEEGGGLQTLMIVPKRQNSVV